MKTLNVLTVFLICIATHLAHTGTLCEELNATGATQEQLAQRGCCSHHSGVCGCDGARLICCDGTLSPSCGCHNHEDVQKTHQPTLPKS